MLERRELDGRIKRLVDAIEAGGDAVSLTARLRALESRRTAIDGEFAGLQPVRRLPAAVVESRLKEWRRLLRQSPTQARAVLQRVLRGPLVFTPCGDGYDFEAPTRLTGLFIGCVIKGEAMEVPDFMKADAGIGREDFRETVDAQYSELLERAYGQWVASPTGFDTLWTIVSERRVAAA